MALTFPAGPTGGQVYNGPNGVDYTYDAILGVWTASVGIAPTPPVTSVTGTLPITVTGAATTPIIGINAATTTTAGSLSAADKVKIDALPATIVAAVTGTAPIAITGTAANPNVTITAATTAAAGSVELADSTEAAAGTDATRAMTPATSVPKTPADMTGAALIPGGNNAARPAPVEGMLRYNNQTAPAVMEYYDGTAWVTLSTGGGGLGNVIFGQGNQGGSASITVAHASVDLAKSYIILNSNVFTGNGGLTITARTATSFTASSPSSVGSYSYFIVY